MDIKDLKVGSKYYISCLVEYTRGGQSLYTEEEIHIGKIIDILDYENKNILIDCPTMGGLQLVGPKAIISEVVEKKKWWEFWK